MPVEPLDFRQLRVYPLAQRQSLSRVENLLVEPESPAVLIDSKNAEQIKNCALSIRSARQRGAAVILIYGAHLLRNGATKILTRLMERGLITHLATNGAGKGAKREIVQVFFRAPADIMEKADAATQARNIPTTRQNWLLEAILEKLEREGASS